jgi:hypothetical protein
MAFQQSVAGRRTGACLCGRQAKQADLFARHVRATLSSPLSELDPALASGRHGRRASNLGSIGAFKHSEGNLRLK